MVGQPPMYRVLATSSARVTAIVALAILFLVSFPLAGQQSYVTRYDVYGGYAFLNSSSVGLFEHGFASQVGFRPKTWVSVGFDYTIAAGNLTCQTRPTAAGVADPAPAWDCGGNRRGAAPSQLPIQYLERPGAFQNSDLRAGPQLAYRHFSKATLFLRPVYAGIIHETATPQPQDPVVKALVSG